MIRYEPFFADPVVGKMKFDNFVRDYGIVSDGDLHNWKRHRLFNGYLNYNDYRCTLFDHRSVWNGIDKNGKKHKYVVFQPYGKFGDFLIDKVLNQNPLFVAYCYYYGHRVDVFYENHGKYGESKYNWHNDGTVFVLITLDAGRPVVRGDIEPGCLPVYFESFSGGGPINFKVQFPGFYDYYFPMKDLVAWNEGKLFKI